MIVFLGWNEARIKAGVEIEVFFGKWLDVTVFVSNATWSTKGPSSVSITGLKMLVYIIRTEQLDSHKLSTICVSSMTSFVGSLMTATCFRNLSALFFLFYRTLLEG